ncbi:MULTISPECIES: hypothetical protein [unclassified Streptomyces]|uniref:hypothetical protein n=1 Tax=unclassified Streptomyces TaxID=2593676 RepID=UPI0035D96E40
MLLTGLVRQLDGLAAEQPLVAWKALADVRHVIAPVGEDAAHLPDGSASGAASASGGRS